MNRDPIGASGAGGAVGTHEQTLALYRLMDELRERHPGVEIESCSSGGARINHEMLRRTERVWTSDCVDALERQTIHSGASMLILAWAPSQTPLLLLLPGLDPDRLYKVGHLPLPGERRWPQRSAVGMDDRRSRPCGRRTGRDRPASALAPPRDRDTDPHPGGVKLRVR